MPPHIDRNWYRRSAQAGFGPGQVNLARCYIEGRGTPADSETARQWLGEARQQGLKEASTLLDWLAEREAAKPAR